MHSSRRTPLDSAPLHSLSVRWSSIPHSTVKKSFSGLPCGLSRELGFIAGNNILEEFQLDLLFQETSSCLIHFEVWSAFDSMLTDSGAFPMLRRVSVDFRWFSIYRNLSVPEQDAILESIKEDNFPRLVESKAVEFNFSAAEVFYSKHA